MSENGISWLSTKQERQLAKLQLAETKRQQTGTEGYRDLRYLDLTELPTVYSGNDVVDNPNPDGLIQGRPWKTTPNTVVGIWRSKYTGYFGAGPGFGGGALDPSDVDVNWFDTQTPIETVEVTDLSIESTDETVSYQWLGYFKPPATANYTFYILSDDESYFWVGPKAITAYTADNADMYVRAVDGEVSWSTALTGGQYYPIRLQYGNSTAGGLLSVSWSNDVEFTTDGLVIQLQPSVAAARTDPNTWLNSITDFPAWNATSTDFPATVTLISGLSFIEYNSALPKYWEIANPTTGDFTASIWFNTNSTTGTGLHFYDNPALIGGDVYGIANDWGMVIANGRVGVGAVSGQTVFTTVRYNDNKWHCATVTRVQTTGVFKIYVDGIFQVEMTEAPGEQLTASDTIRLGADPNNGQPYTGLIGEFDFWQLALSDQQLAYNFEVQRSYYGV